MRVGVGMQGQEQHGEDQRTDMDPGRWPTQHRQAVPLGRRLCTRNCTARGAGLLAGLGRGG